ncbi:MAG: sigma-54 dependent transcriptional regulator [Gammaproteobacteria bacterium]|nr:sigma-54 dependent transcriptional regulator [Gammaproteobacteria bacterium]
MVKNILIVDDEPDIRELLEITLSRMQLEPTAAANIKDAKAILSSRSIDLCLTDMKLPDGDGIELVSYIQNKHPNMPVAVITAYGSMDAAIKALKAGAFDFVSKPLDIKILRKLVSGALKLTNGENEKLIEETSQHGSRLIGNSSEMQKLNSTILKLARSQAPVYIRGESGVGKELVAKEIHLQGPRSDQPFIPVNCGAIPTELMESEFFGHVKGSFTGASSDKQGLFEAAQGGTLFLDEVAELPLHMQVKLLRAIQERAIKPVGKQEEIIVDVRILSATHKDLSQEVEQGNFRQDLFYRINVIELPVPPLRDRSDDIETLSNYILNKISENYLLENLTINELALKKLCNYSFPGNIRELENILERAATLCENENITAEDILLPNDLATNIPTVDDISDSESSSMTLDKDQLEAYLEDKEKQAITAALEKTRWNKTAAAKILGISFRQLRYRLKKLDLE